MTYASRALQNNDRRERELAVDHMGCSAGDVSEEPVTWEKRKKDCRMSCDVGQETEVLENEL